MPVNRHMRNGKSGSNRNYAAMRPEKLVLCIKDLRHGISATEGKMKAEVRARILTDQDNAWARCVLKDGDPEIDLIVALEELGRKVYDKR